jgi:K+ transporter
VALTYLCVLAGAVLFRSTTIARASSMLAAMAGLHGLGDLQPDIHVPAQLLWLVILYAIVWLAPTTRQWMLAEPAHRFAWHPSPSWAVVMGCAATLAVLAAGGTSEFVYFRF